MYFMDGGSVTGMVSIEETVRMKDAAYQHLRKEHEGLKNKFARLIAVLRTLEFSEKCGHYGDSCLECESNTKKISDIIETYTEEGGVYGSKLAEAVSNCHVQGISVKISPVRGDAVELMLRKGDLYSSAYVDKPMHIIDLDGVMAEVIESLRRKW